MTVRKRASLEEGLILVRDPCTRVSCKKLGQFVRKFLAQIAKIGRMNLAFHYGIGCPYCLYVPIHKQLQI